MYRALETNFTSRIVPQSCQPRSQKPGSARHVHRNHYLMLRNTLFGLVNHSIVCKRICRYTVSKQLWRKYVIVKHPVGIVQQQFNYLFFFLWLRISQMKNMTNKQNTVADPATMALITFCPGLPFVVVSLLITSVVPVRWSVAGAVCIKQLQSKGTGNL